MDDEFEGEHDGDDEPEALDDHEAAMVEQDLLDLADFEEAFAPEGYRGVAVFCQDCVEDHYYPWGMLRENLELLLETGDIPVHEPAYAPEPHRYVPWDYARGYVDALRDLGANDREPLTHCPRCGVDLPDAAAEANFCPRCGAVLLLARLRDALSAAGIEEGLAAAILRAAGLPTPQQPPPTGS
jgi:hypothetical protein